MARMHVLSGVDNLFAVVNKQLVQSTCAGADQAGASLAMTLPFQSTNGAESDVIKCLS